MKIALIGYGKMGKTIEKIAIERGHQIVSIIDIDNREDFASEAFKSADVAIEFTAPHVAYENCITAMAAGVKVVSGSTGWYQQHEAEMREKCEKEGKTLFWSSNFSLGVAIFSAVNKYLARIMSNFDNYRVGIEETHHIHKLDAPSGTAITLAEGILENISHKFSWVMGDLTNPDGTVTKGAAPRATEIKIDAIRRDEVPGIHTITY
ncbi:MAG: 4-hydroxy-tetrahydrodipicolinate reductase, partial [Bacteroidaceae bacterium]|nr:4-hydroxy-tetrahydrodipicolinate reductase [Bacteroidaceae bacterium]